MLKRFTVIYLVSYLVAGGLGLLLVPATFLELFRSTGNYGDIMPRVAGMFMLALGGFIATTLYFKDFKYYRFSVVLRTLIVILLMIFYNMSSDPFFLMIMVIVLIGLLPSYVALLVEKKNG